MTAAALEISGLTVRYGETLALDDVSIRVESGRICGVVGMNGSGKSTLFSAIMGLVRPESGTVLVDNRAPDAARARGDLGYVPQSEKVDWSFPVSVRDVVMMGRYGHLGVTRRPRAADHTAVADALDRVDLIEFADRQIGQLSGGQKKRAFVARGIAQQARVLLLDEPFAGVDARSESTISRLLHELADAGTTILVSTHNLNTLPALATESVLLMRRVLMHGATTEVLQPQNLARAFGLDVLERDGTSE